MSSNKLIHIFHNVGSGNQEAQDYQGRTPLHLTAELDRTNAADCLITLPVPAEVRVQDQVGNIAVASMTRTMPTVVSCRATGENVVL